MRLALAPESGSLSGSVSSFTLTTADGVVLTARRHRASGRRRSAVVLVHGFTASKDHPEVVAVAEALAAAGHDVVTYDTRGHQTSGGTCTLGDTEWLDVAAAVDLARDLDPRVVTVGASLGGIAVLRHATHDPHLSGVVAVSAPAVWRLPRNLRAVFSTFLTRTRVGRAIARRHLGVRIDPVWAAPPPPVELTGRIRAPLAIIHGDADQMIPPAAAAQLVEGFGGEARLDIVAGMGHAFDPAGIPAILGAVDWTLTRSSGGSAPVP